MDTMPKIFISYRRQDSQIMSERIHDKLCQVYGEKEVFLDVSDDIPPGANWEQVLMDNLEKSEVLLVIIGSEWQRLLQERLNQQDFVRFEVEQGLKRGSAIFIIPILVNNATVPQNLPDALRPLLGHQVMSVRQNPDFHPDMDKLIKAINTREKSPVNWRLLVGMSILAMVTMIAYAILQGGNTGQQTDDNNTVIINHTNDSKSTITPFLALNETPSMLFETDFDDVSVLDSFAFDSSRDGITFDTIDGKSVMVVQSSDWFAMAPKNTIARNVVIEAEVRVVVLNPFFDDVFFLARGSDVAEYQAAVSVPNYAGFNIWDGTESNLIAFGEIDGTFANWHTIRFALIDQQAQLFVDDVLIAENDALENNKFGRVGIQQAPDVVAYWDYLTIEILDAP